MPSDLSVDLQLLCQIGDSKAVWFEKLIVQPLPLLTVTMLHTAASEGVAIGGTCDLAM